MLVMSVPRVSGGDGGGRIGEPRVARQVIFDAAELAFDLDGALEEESHRQFIGHAHAAVQLDRLLAESPEDPACN